MFTGTQYFLYLSPQIGGLLKAGGLGPEWLGEFPGNESGPQALSSLLLKQAAHPVWILVDSIDEDYRLETLPHVSGKARAEMVRRRLRQIYRGQPYCHALSQGREKTGRKDDRYLMSALNDSSWLSPWLSTLDALEFPLAGISLVSGAAQALASRLKIREPQMLLVSRQRAGIRFSYFEQGALRFSRLVPASKTEHNYADEVSRTMLYLTSQRIITREIRCTVLLLDFSSHLGPTIASLNADPLFDARQITLSQAARASRMPESLLRTVPGAALIGAQAQGKPAINLAPGQLTAPHTQFRKRLLIRRSAVAILLAGLGGAGTQWLQATHYKSETQNLSAALTQNERLYQEALKVYPDISIPPEMLQQAIQTASLIDSSKEVPEQALNALSAALDRHPEIILQNLKWEDSLVLGRGQGYHLEVQVEIKPFDGNYRAALQQIRGFMGTLSGQAGAYGLSLLESPASPDASKPLSGSTMDNHVSSQADFKVSFDFRGDAT
jgi:hypothetical protein